MKVIMSALAMLLIAGCQTNKPAPQTVDQCCIADELTDRIEVPAMIPPPAMAATVELPEQCVEPFETMSAEFARHYDAVATNLQLHREALAVANSDRETVHRIHEVTYVCPSQ